MAQPATPILALTCTRASQSTDGSRGPQDSSTNKWVWGLLLFWWRGGGERERRGDEAEHVSLEHLWLPKRAAARRRWRGLPAGPLGLLVSYSHASSSRSRIRVLPRRKRGLRAIIRGPRAAFGTTEAHKIHL